MLLTRFCLRNPIAVTLFYALVTLLGMAALAQMGRSVLPPVSFPVVAVTAAYPGASPQEVERLVIEPIEDALDTLPNVERVSASAQYGIAELTVRFRFGSGLDADRTNVQQAVDAARANMPADLVPPVVSKDDPSQAPIMEEAVSSAVLSAGDLSDLLKRRIVPALRASSGVGNVVLTGSLTRQFTVRPDIAPLNALGATALDVFRAVSAANDTLPGGVLKSPVRESTIGINAAATTKEELEQLPVAIPGNPSVRLRDVATVSDSYAGQTVISRVDGEATAVVLVSHSQGADAARTIHTVQKIFSRLARLYPLVRFEQLRTDEPSTNAAVDGVLQTLGEGIVLTVLVILLFLHAWRNAAIAAISIPASLCAAFIAMWAFGFTLNVLSLMGLSLTIGILVDDSIVIIEAIARNAARGLKGDDAALAGRKELGGAAFAITLVDVAVFAPIAAMSGVVGEFMREFGLVIVFATAFSLLVSLTLTPLLAAKWSLKLDGAPLDSSSFAGVFEQLRKRAKRFPWTFRGAVVLRIFALWHDALNRFNACEESIARKYADKWLPAVMARRKTVVASAALACALSLVPVFSGAIPAEFSPPVNRGEASVDLELPAGTPLERTDAAAQRLTQALLSDPGVKHVETTAGRAFNGSDDIFASNLAQLTVILADSAANGEATIERLKNMAYLVPGASMAGAGKGMGGEASISYNVGGDPAVIDRASQRIAQALQANPYATDVRTANGGLRMREQIDIDSEKARLLNVSTDDAAQIARIASGGSIATKARLSSGLVDVVVQSDAAQRGDLDALRRLAVRSKDSRLVPLGDVARIVAMQEPSVIQRENRERVVTVSANTVNGTPIGLVTSRISRVLRDPGFLPDGARIEPRGDLEQFLDTVGKMLTALGASIVAVYAILAILYRSYTLPLVTMLTVPFASIGAFGTLFVLNASKAVFPDAAILQSQTLNLYSMLGVVMLVGLVAKNGILLVEYAERRILDGVDAGQAMRSAARRRFRPILMTTFAMIAGMLPLALGHTAGAEYRKALGTVVIGGLSSSLLLTLFIVPAVYVAYRGLRPPVDVVADRLRSRVGSLL